MRRSQVLRFLSMVGAGLLFMLSPSVVAQDIGPNLPDEPIAEKFSLANAIKFADLKARQWQSDHDCVTCHTNGLYLVARAVVGSESAELANARKFATDYLKRFVGDEAKANAARNNVQGVVSTTAYLAIAEYRIDDKLSASTRRFFEHIWTLQNKNGSWDWLKCNWPPFEVDDHYGATLVAIACGTIQAQAFESESTRQGMAQLRKYLKTTKPENLHQKAMVLWASRAMKGIVDKPMANQWIQELSAAQNPDGGWSTAALGSGQWQRPNGGAQDLASDGYATALCVYVLQQVGISRHDPRLDHGLAWLKANQRKSGRWFVRSLRSDNHHFISHAATNMALMALSLDKERKP